MTRARSLWPRRRDGRVIVSEALTLGPGTGSVLVSALSPEMVEALAEAEAATSNMVVTWWFMATDVVQVGRSGWVSALWWGLSASTAYVLPMYCSTRLGIQSGG